MKPALRDTAVIIVNYRTKELTENAVLSVLAEVDVTEVIVVDNASGDDSARHLRSTLRDERVRVVEATTNGGFGAGANLGVDACRSSLVLILNSDATLHPGSLGVLVTALLADDAVGLIAPAVLRAEDALPQPAAFGRLPRRWEIQLPGVFRRRVGKGGPVEWVTGVAMLLRTSDFRSVGGFDEDFKMYFEDLDLCRRIRARGQVVQCVAAAQVTHMGGKSWQSSREQAHRYHVSRAIYARKLGATAFEVRLISLSGWLRTVLGGR